MKGDVARGLLVVGAAALLTGCAIVTTGSTPRSLAESHHRRAAALEQKGELRRALDEWKIALTIEPHDRVARDRKTRLERRLAGGVATHTRLAQEALRRGAPVEARRHLLAVLALDPANRTAFETLQGVREVAFAVHTVGRGESLADIAERYYGDRLRAEVIWQTNQLPARTRLTAGMELKIPEIAGLPFRVDSKGGGHDAAREDMEPEVNPLLVDTREAYDRGQYDLALAGVERLLDGNPHNAEWVELKKSILYAFGKASLDQKRYDDSYHSFSQLARLDPKYHDGGELARQTRLLAIQHHYNEGIRLYREEQVEAAIAEWRLVLQYEPQHVDARKNIDQAQRVLRALQERQRKQ
jgi:tetratricopeptide (TPR) repeat protein